MPENKTVFHDAKFSMAEIARATGTEPFFAGGITYGSLQLKVPIGNGKMLWFYQGDSEDDNSVDIINE